MKNGINQVAALFLIYLLLVSPFTLAQDEISPTEASAQDTPEQLQNEFNNNPTPENFNNLPNPTAADLAKVSNPTLENFNHLSADQQGTYLADEKFYQQEFAERYYSSAANWGTNAQADTVFFKQQTGLRDFLNKGTAEKNTAQQYFIKTFSAPYNFNQIAEDFFFDQEKGMLKNGLTNLILAEFKDDKTITSITSTTGGFEISRKIDEKEQKVSVAGTEAKTVSYDQKKGSFTFKLPNGQQQFQIPNDAQVIFTFDAGEVIVDGPASGIVNIQGDYAQFVNHNGKLAIRYDGDIDAEDAEVITSRLFMDGRYSKKGAKIEAWDVGLSGKQTVVVDKSACPEVGACVGVTTQGQWDARYLSDKDKSRASTLKINLDEVSSTSSFYVDPTKAPPTGEEKAKQLREQAQQLRKPAQPPLQGNNAEVWINKDEDSKAITVTSKGVVAVGLYDARGSSAKQLKDAFSYKGLNGLSEFDAQFSARTQTNVRGQAEFKNDQFREGIATNQDGAVIKVTHDNFRPDQADVLRLECFDCRAGEAVVIQKSINIAKETEVKGVFIGAERSSVRLVVDVDENGKIKPFEPSRQDLGFLSKQILQDGQEVSIGNNLLVSVPCGDLECNFKLSRDPRTAELGASYEFIDPKKPEAAVKKIEYPLSIGKALGSEAVLVSDENAAEVSKLAVLIEEGKFNELSKLSFDKDDPGYAALKKKFLLESGLNLDAVSDSKYARELQTIIETTTKARAAYQKYGIELDAFGNFKTREDAEKYQKIVNKGLGADVDELTRAKWDLSRMRVKEVEGLLAACQGTAYCSVSEKDLKAAKEEENKILKVRTSNYNRWKVLVAREELEKLKKEAEERAKRADKGIEATDKKELEDTKIKIDHGEKRKVDLTHTLGNQEERVRGYRSEIRSKLKDEWLAGGGGGAQFMVIDWNRYETDPEYVMSLVNKHAPRDFFTNELDPDVIQLRENLRADAQAVAENKEKLGRLENDLKAWDSQNQALIEKYRLEGKDDVAAEVALAAGKYEEVTRIISGPNLATQEGIKEVVKLGKDKEGNVVVLETLDVSVLAGQSVISDTVAKDITGRAVGQQRDESLDQVALLYNYGYGNEAGAKLQAIEAADPELAQKLKDAEGVPEALLDPNLVKLKQARLAQTDYAKRVLGQRERDLEQANHQAKLKKEEENLGAGSEVARAWEGLNFDASVAGVLGTVEGAGRLAEASFGFVFDSSEKAAADALGITDIRDDLDKQAFEQQQRQLDQLHSLRNKLRDYEKKGLSAGQALADAKAGIDRGVGGVVLSSSPELQISVFDEPAAALLEFDLTRSVFSEEDKKLMKDMNELDRSTFINQRQQEYEAEWRELEFNVIARDAENTQRFNRNKLAGEAAAKYKEAVAVCPTCAGAKNVQLQLDTLKQNVLGEIIAVYTGEEAGKVIAGGLERVGVTYTRETEESFRDMAISSFDALAVFDIAEAVVGGPLAIIDTLQKLRKVSKAVDAAGTAIDAYRYASKGSREVFAAAKAAERMAFSPEVVAEARKAIDAAKIALDAEIKAGREASKYQKFERAINTPLGKFDRDVATARNVEIDNIAAQTQNLNQAQRELTAARASGDALAEGQSLVKMSQADEAIARSVQNIDELDELLKVSNIAGPNRGSVRKAFDSTFGKVFGAGPGEEVLESEENFRRAADNFADVSVNARLVGDTEEAILSRARLNSAKENLEVAAKKLENAYLDRKVERSKNAIKETLQQAQVSGSGDEVYDVVGPEGISKLDELASNPAVRIEPEGTGLRFEVPEEAPQQLRIEVEEGNKFLLKIDTSEARAEAELEEQLLETLANSEYVAANDVKARRLEAVGEKKPEGLVSGVVDHCTLAAAAIYGLATCVEVVTEAVPTIKSVSERAPPIILEERLPELENSVHLDAENVPTAFQRQIQAGKELEQLLAGAPLSEELYLRTTRDTHGALKLPVFENNLPPKYTLYEISMDRSTVKGLNDVSYELGTSAISTQHRELIAFAEQKGLPITTLQKTTFIAVPEGSATGIDEVLNAVENARAATSQVTKQPIKLRVGIADNADTLMETRLRAKRSLEFSEQNNIPPAKYGEDVKDWYNQLPVEQKAAVNDIFVGYDERLKDEFAALDALRKQGLTEEYGQKVTQLAVVDLQNAKFSNLPTIKKYQSDPVTGIKEGDAVISTDGISVGQRNKGDVLLLTEQNLPDTQLAAQLGKNVDNSMVRVNEKIKETYFRAVDNVNIQPAEAIAKYDEIATAAKYPGGAVTNTDELKDFWKWEFEQRGRFRGGDETFMTVRKEVLEANPDFAKTLQEAVRVCESCYEVRVGFKEVGAGETYVQAISAADQALISSKKLGDVPVVVDKFGNVASLGEPKLKKGIAEAMPLESNVVSSAVDPCTVVGGAVYGAACKFPEVEEVTGEILEEAAEKAPFEVSSQTRELFSREAVTLAKKDPLELQSTFYGLYNRKTAPSVVEEGKVNHGLTTIDLYKKLASKEIGIDPGMIQSGWIGLGSTKELPLENLVRYYFDSKNLDSSLEVVEKVAKELSDQKIPFKIKTHPNKAKFATRTDNTVLYVDAAHREQVEKVIAQLNPALFDEEVPLFTQKINKGISWAEDPGNLFYKGKTPEQIERLRNAGISAPSFGQKRSEALAEVYIETGGKVSPEFDEVARQIFRKHGIDPDQPWVNLDSPLKKVSAPPELGVRVVEPVSPVEAPIPVEILEPQVVSSVKYDGKGVFEYAGKRYTYDIGTGTWSEKRTLWFDKKVTNEDITLILDEEWSRRLEEGTLDVSDSTLACAFAGGAIYGAACTFPEVAGVTRAELLVEEAIPQWREAVSSENLVKIQKQALESKTEVIIGEAKFYTKKRDKFLFLFPREKTVEGVQTLKYEPNGFFNIEIKDPKTGEEIASQNYKIIGDEMQISLTMVSPAYQGGGINTRIFQQTMDLHPEVKYVKTSLELTNSKVYLDYLRKNPRATPLDAVRQTPAYKIRKSAGLEIDLERSVLPSLREAEDGKDVILVSKRVEEASEEVARRMGFAKELEEIPPPRPILEGIVSEAADACAFAGGAVYGLGPCLGAGKAEVSEYEAITKPVTSKIGVKAPLPIVSDVKLKAIQADPEILAVSGEDQWNSLVGIIKKHEREPKLDRSDLERLLEDPAYIGKGVEGVVMHVPEEVRAVIPGIDKPAVIKIRNYVYPDAEEFTLTFQEAVEVLNDLKGKDVVPDVYKWGENYYIVEKLEGELMADFRFRLYEQELETGRDLAAQRKLWDSLDELTNKLADAGVVIDDFHSGNIFLVETPEGFKAKAVDVGYAYHTDPESARKIYAVKKAELLQGKIMVNPNLPAIRQRERDAAAAAALLAAGFPSEVSAIEAATSQQLAVALQKAGVQDERVISNILTSKGKKRINRMYEARVEPLTVAIKLDNIPTSIEEGIFELKGKKYVYDVQEGWSEQRRFWFDKGVEDPVLFDELTTTNKLLIEEGLLPPPELKIKACPFAGGAVAGTVITPCLPPSPIHEITLELPPSELPKPQVVSKVQGYENAISNLYDRVAPENVDEVFQRKLEFVGENIYGGKAVAYILEDGSVQVAFLTETEKTHHRLALGTIIGGEKGELVYNGEYDHRLLVDLPNRAFGFELQFDKSRGKIVGIQASSQLSNLQKGKGVTGWRLPVNAVDYVEQELLEKIDLDLIDESMIDKPVNEWIDKSNLPIASFS